MDRPTIHAVARGAIAILVLFAIAYQAWTLIGSGFFRPLRFFAFFTILSNLFGAAVFLALAFRRGRTHTRTFDLLRGAAVVYLMVTLVVVLVLLSGAELQVAVPWVDFLVHRVFPIIVLIDWLIDPPSTDLRVKDVVLWLAFPLIWLVVTLIRGAVDHWYPYPFLDPGNGGYRSVAFHVGMILAGFLVIGGAVNAVSDILRERARRRFV
ncbi:MAG TPA: Pr6Pr family membrane protein [Candidatus Limnocylindrales bacterium]|nr:Pr6Pr family membrane protein [Candidatus Limnocylindrales bacterium]